jgi:diguanylate cyclase
MLRINVSPAELVSRGFVRAVADITGEFGIGGARCAWRSPSAVVREIEIT